MANPGFLLAEDAAVKGRFSGLTVSDDREQARPVQVFFRYPDGETERAYPFITIEMIDLVHARNRQHSESQLVYAKTGTADRNKFNQGPAKMTYWPSQVSDMDTVPGSGSSEFILSNEFVPVDLLYQISTFTRSAIHDRQLTAKILSTVIPFRKGFIDVAEDGTIRRFDLLDWTTADLLDSEAGYRKRIFRKIYTLQMSAEIPSLDMFALPQVTSIVSTINYTTTTPVTPDLF